MPEQLSFQGIVTRGVVADFTGATFGMRVLLIRTAGRAEGADPKPRNRNRVRFASSAIHEYADQTQVRTQVLVRTSALRITRGSTGFDAHSRAPFFSSSRRPGGAGR